MCVYVCLCVHWSYTDAQNKLDTMMSFLCRVARESHRALATEPSERDGHSRKQSRFRRILTELHFITHAV